MRNTKNTINVLHVMLQFVRTLAYRPHVMIPNITGIPMSLLVPISATKPSVRHGRTRFVSPKVTRSIVTPTVWLGFILRGILVPTGIVGPIRGMTIGSGTDPRGGRSVSHPLNQARPRGRKGSFGTQLVVTVLAVVIPVQTGWREGMVVVQQFGEHSQLRFDKGIAVPFQDVGQVPISIGVHGITGTDLILECLVGIVVQETLQEFLHKVLAVRTVHYRVVAVAGIPETKAFVVLDRQTNFPGAHPRRGFHPLVRR